MIKGSRMIGLRVSKHRFAVLPLAAAAALAMLGASDPAAAKSKHRAEKKDPYAVTTRAPGEPVLALVSLDDQQVTIYDADGPILRAPVSSGQTGLETPVGIYAVLQKEAEHYSNVYDDAAMPHMERITWSGVALHGGALPGYPASHGCVRMPYKFAARLFGLTHVGMRVVVARDDVSPVPISHPLLFKRTPYQAGSGLVTKAAALVGIGQSKAGEEPADVAERTSALQAIKETKSAEAETLAKEAEPARAAAKKLEPDMKRAEKALRSAEKVQKRAAERVAEADEDLARATSDKAKARAQKEKERADAKLAEAQAKLEAVKTEVQPKIDAFEQADRAAKALEEKRDAALAEASTAARKLKPVSVFISRATQTLYVRQGFEPIFESPVTIRNPDKSIGTYTYTAVDYGEGGSDMRWNVVSVGVGGASRDRDYDRYDVYDDYDYDDYDRPRRRRHKPATKADATPTDAKTAAAALDRITIPEDAVARISELVLPGSSLIVSDEAAHKETGKATDFIVLISSEPQGGIKKRPKPVDPYADYYGDDQYYYDPRYGRRRQYRGPFFSFW
jgi:L,D-transpeptidase catalytic domain